jgi:Protein of unknown function (DUF3485)
MDTTWSPLGRGEMGRVMPRILPVVTVVFLLAAYGVAEGLWSDRWVTSAALSEAPARLASLPLVAGPWKGTDEELDARQILVGELKAHLFRRYVHETTGEGVTVLAVCGRPGPIAVHSPEVCFGGSGFTPKGARVRHKVEADGLSGPAEFWSERYEKKGALPEYLQIYYGWNDLAGWQAVDNPRLKFAPARALYKVYIVRRLAQPDEAAENNPVPAFLSLLIPQFDRCLAATP